MANDKLDRLGMLFEEAALKEPAERLTFVRRACEGDPEMRRTLEAMLVTLDQSVVIDRPVTEAVADLLADSGRSLSGTLIGPYRVDSLLGTGGMGEVYRATDTMLGRGVAIKLLPEGLATDPERLARFRREARMLAALSHPNIAAVHELETLEGPGGQTLALVMELVDGPTLAERLAGGPLAVDEALAVARQIAEALDTAHEQGIVHRDLKPANVKVRDDGTVKVLDFGLAKLVEFDQPVRSPDLSPTITTPAMTAAGIILGTAAYMSPEQAKGKPADRRSDVWAFGCVLYEMLTGRRAFQGDDVADTLAAVLRGEPDWRSLPPDVPQAVTVLLHGCLVKDVRQRVADMSTATFVLANAGALAVGPAGAPVMQRRGPGGVAPSFRSARRSQARRPSPRSGSH